MSDQDDEDGLGSFQCMFCESSFSENKDLTFHLLTHIGEDQFTCELCYKSYSSRADMRRHEDTCGKQGKYHCGICMRSFSKRYSLKLHFRFHTGEKPYSCDICQESFARTYDLTKHQKQHKVEDDSKCEFCNEKLDTFFDVLHHERLHSSQKAQNSNKGITCGICNKRLSTQALLKRHQWKAHKPFICDICNATFSVEAHLDFHKNLHHKQPAPCNDKRQLFHHQKGPEQKLFCFTTILYPTTSLIQIRPKVTVNEIPMAPIETAKNRSQNQMPKKPPIIKNPRIRRDVKRGRNIFDYTSQLLTSNVLRLPKVKEEPVSETVENGISLTIESVISKAKCHKKKKPVTYKRKPRCRATPKCNNIFDYTQNATDLPTEIKTEKTS